MSTLLLDRHWFHTSEHLKWSSTSVSRLRRPAYFRLRLFWVGRGSSRDDSLWITVSAIPDYALLLLPIIHYDILQEITKQPVSTCGTWATGHCAAMFSPQFHRYPHIPEKTTGAGHSSSSKASSPFASASCNRWVVPLTNVSERTSLSPHTLGLSGR